MSFFAIRKKVFVWIGDESLLSILLNEYHLVDVDTRQKYYRNIIQKRKHGSHVDIISKSCRKIVLSELVVVNVN